MSICSIEGCGKSPCVGRGWCRKHYQRWFMHGDPTVTLITPAKTPLIDRLRATGWAEIIRRPDLGACWEWNGRRDQFGYGMIKFQQRGVRVHRAMWEISNGRKIPDGLNALHKCDNPPCINPGHIFPGTQQENIADMNAKGRARGGRKFTEKQIAQVRAMYATGEYKQSEIEEMFGMSNGHVSRIVRHEIWRDDTLKIAA